MYIDKETRKQIFFISGLILLVLVAGFFAYMTINIGMKSNGKDSLSDENNSQLQEKLNLVISPDSQSMSPGKNYNVDVNLSDINQKPNAVSLELLFDPNAVEVVSIKEGNIWGKTNILQKNINKNGSATVDMGQGFGTTFTGQSKIATFVIKVKSTTNLNKVSLTLGNNSGWVSDSNQGLKKISASETMISIVKN